MPRRQQRIVCVDPGHGGAQPGAIGAGGLREADVNLDVGVRFAAILDKIREPRIRAVLTRDQDVTLGLRARATWSNEHNADLFISLHCNAAEDVGASGFEVWTSCGDTAADPVATRVWEAIKDEFPEMRARIGMDDPGTDPDFERDFTVLARTKAPAVLVEMGFLTNPTEEVMLRSVQFHVRMAMALSRAVLRTFALWDKVDR